MMERSAQPFEGGGGGGPRPPLLLYLPSRTKLVYAPADTLPLFLLYPYMYSVVSLHRVHIFTRDETGLVCLPTQLEHSATLLVMVNVMKGGVRAPPTLASLG